MFESRRDSRAMSGSNLSSDESTWSKDKTQSRDVACVEKPCGLSGAEKLGEGSRDAFVIAHPIWEKKKTPSGHEALEAKRNERGMRSSGRNEVSALPSGDPRRTKSSRFRARARPILKRFPGARRFLLSKPSHSRP